MSKKIVISQQWPGCFSRNIATGQIGRLSAPAVIKFAFF